MCLLCCCRRKHQHGTGDDDGDKNDFNDISATNARSTSSSQRQQHSNSGSNSPRRNKGILGGLFSRKKKADEEDRSTDGSEAEALDQFPKELKGPPPTFTPHAPNDFHPSVIQSKITEVSNENSTIVHSAHPSKKVNPAALPPSARQSAFHGPPRFDWIDIEYAAATKIQSVHRRNMVMKNLEQRGLSTSAIRNRKRRRKAVNRSYHTKVQQHAETPSLFNCCAAGLAFGALTDDDDRAYREYQRRQYEERVRQQQEHEEEMRRKYLQEHGMKEANQILEIMEVQD
ncbi:hypothetical protein IV203_013777 [Nitzschia inconspicua]|uniref:Uncharacterized protein n=1 Tax=Nitzschia inconspicua TaxID=303405 RepID=A0A9K3Q7P9_9STRA|nr:hypothetical protein IV203_013777 [Nitzschia inconspicua]